MKKTLLLLVGMGLLFAPFGFAEGQSCKQKYDICYFKCDGEHRGDKPKIRDCRKSCASARVTCSSKSTSKTLNRGINKGAKKVEKFLSGLTD